MENHGDYKIFDYFKAIKEGYISKDYKNLSGIEDSKLLKIAKEKILKLNNKNKPFNCTILTSNMQYPACYIEENYERKFKNKYDDAVFCSCMQIKEFVYWLSKQNFFKDTTVVIVGDCIKSKKSNAKENQNLYKRTIYNLFINSKAKPIKIKNRIFCLMDMFPTTLASLGIEINGDRLALGTNLFSNKKTLAEKLGIEKLNTELKKESISYDFNFLY